MAKLSTLIPNMNKITEEHAQPEEEVHLEPTEEVHREPTGLQNNQKFDQLQGNKRERKKRGGDKKKKKTSSFQMKLIPSRKSTMQARDL